MIEGIVLIVVSSIVIVVAINLLKSVKAISAQGIEVEGIVFDIKQAAGTTNNISYPIIRFLTNKNDWITESSKIGVIPGMYKVGKKVTVVYHIDNPGNFFIKSKLTYFVPIAMLVIAIVLVGVGVFTLVNV